MGGSSYTLLAIHCLPFLLTKVVFTRFALSVGGLCWWRRVEYTKSPRVDGLLLSGMLNSPDSSLGPCTIGGAKNSIRTSSRL